MADYLSQEQILSQANTYNSFIPITRTEEDELVTNSLKNNWNVYIDTSIGSAEWISGGDVAKSYRISQGPVDLSRSQDRWNLGAIEKSQYWYGGIFGQSPQQLERQWNNLTGEELGMGTWVPFYTGYSTQIDAERRRIDETFVQNKNKEIDNVLVSRFGQDNAPKISKILEQDYGVDWKNTFAKGAKNPNAYLEQVNEHLQNKAIQTTQLSEIRNSLNNISTPFMDTAPRWVWQNLIADYDMVASTALTMGIDFWAAGGIGALKNLTVGAAKLPVYTALKYANPVSRSSIAQMFPRMATIMGGDAVGAGGRGVFRSLAIDLGLQNKNLAQRVFRTGAIDLRTGSQIGPLPIPKNPFNPATNFRSWMKWNAAKIIQNGSAEAATNSLNNKALDLLNKVGLTIDDVLFIGQTSGLGEQMFKMARVGAILGGADGFANSVWSQHAAHDKILMQEDKDLPGFDLGLAIHDAAVFSAFGAVLGGVVMAPLFAPIRSATAAYSLVDGSATLGTKTPRRGLKQLFGADRVTVEQWKMQSDIVRIAGPNGLAAVQVGKTATMEQLRTVLKALTGNSKHADFYLDPNWLAQHNISVHEVSDVVRHMLEVLAKASPEYSINPVSHQLLSEIFLDLARAKKDNPNLESGTMVDLIRGQELQEKMERFGALVPEPNKKPLRKYKTSGEVQAELDKLEADVINGTVPPEQYNTKSKALKRLLEKKKTKEANEQRFTQVNEEINQTKTKLETETDPKIKETLTNTLSKLEKESADLKNKLNINDDVQSSTVSVNTNEAGSIDRITISGHDISNTKAGFLLTKYLDRLKKLTEASKIADKNLRTEATVKLRKEIASIEGEMDANFKLHEEGKTRAELRTEWANERWSKIQANPELLAKFREGLSQALEAHRSSTGDRFVSMNWWGELWNGSGFGKLFNAGATYGSGVTDQMYATIDLIYSVSRLIDDGHFFAYSDLANPYQTFSITEAISNGWRKAQTINETLVKLRRLFPEQAKEIEKRARVAIISGKSEINGKGLTEEMVKAGNEIVSLNRDFYQYHADQAKQLGKSYTDSFTYIPQMLMRELAPDEVARLGQLGYEAMRRKIRETGIIPWSELERLGQIVRNPETGEILSIPENSLFYRVGADGQPLPMDEMIASIPKTMEELKILEAKRRLESQSAAQLPADLQEAINTPIGVRNLTDAEKAKVKDSLVSKIETLLNRSQNRVYGDYDLVYATQHLLTLRNLAEELNSDELRSLYSKYITELKEKSGIEINEKPLEAKEVILNEKKNPTDQLQNIFVFVPEIKRDGKVIHAGNVLKRWVPEGTQEAGKFPPSMTFSSRLEELAKGLKDSPFSREAQHLGHAYTMETLIKRLANQFGETEPTSYPNVIPIESLQDSMITMEHLLGWTQHQRFTESVDMLHKSLGGKVNKSTLGMMILSDWVNLARSHNLHLLKSLPEPVLDRIAREFNLFNLTTLRSRLNGTKLDAVNVIELLNKKFNNLLDRRTSPEISRELQSHIFVKPEQYKLWSPDRLHVDPVIKYEGAAVDSVPIIESNNVFGNIERVSKKRRSLETALEKNKVMFERAKAIQELIRKTKDPKEKKALNSELNALRKKLKITDRGFKGVFNKLTSIKNKIESDLNSLVDSRKITKVVQAEELAQLTDGELARIYALYQEGMSQQSIPEPMLDFLFKNLNKEVTVANAFDRLERLGIEAEHILQDGSLSLEGRAAYLKKLANSSEAIQAEANQLNRLKTAKGAKKTRADFEPILNEYYAKRSEIQERIEAAREIHSDYIANVESHQNDLYQLISIKDQLEKKLVEGSEIIDVSVTNFKLLGILENRSLSIQSRLKGINEKIGELTETIKVLQEFSNPYLKPQELEQTLQGYYRLLENLKEQQLKVSRELEDSIRLVENQTQVIKDLQTKSTTELPQTTKLSFLREDIAKVDEQIKLKEKAIKDLEDNDPLVFAEEDLRRLEYEYEGVQGTSKETTIPGRIPRQILQADQYRLEQLERVVELLKKNLDKYEELKAKSNIRTDENINRFEENLYDVREVPSETEGRAPTYEYTEPSVVEHNQAVAEVKARITKFDDAIKRLRKAGITERHKYYWDELKEIEGDITSTIKQLKELNEDTRFTPIDNTLSNFEAVYNWMNDTWNTLNQYTTHAWSVVEASKKAGQTLPINMNQAIRTAESMNAEFAVIREGMSVGLLFRGFEGPDRVRRFTVIDLNDSTLEPKDLVPYKRGGVEVSDLDQAKILVRQRQAHNFDNPNDIINLESLIQKKLREIALVPETEKLTKNVVTLIKSINNWVKGQEEWANLIRQFDSDRLTIAATELMEDPAAAPLFAKLEKDLVASSFNIMGANKEATRKRFGDVWVELQTLKEEAITALELQKAELNEKWNKKFEAFKARARKPVPVFSQERADIIKGLLAEREVAILELRKLGKYIDVNQDLAVLNNRIGELYDLFFRLNEGKIVSDAKISGIDIKTKSNEQRSKLLKELQGSEVSARELVDDSVLGVNKQVAATIQELTGTKFNFTKLVKKLETIKNADGESPIIKIKTDDGKEIYISNEKFLIGDIFRALNSRDVATQEVMYKWIVLQATKQAENDLRRAGITNVIRRVRNSDGDITKEFAVLTEDDIMTSLNDFILTLQAHNNAINTPDIASSLATFKQKVIELKKKNPDWRFNDELRGQIDDLEKQIRSIELPRSFRKQSYRKFKTNKEGFSEKAGESLNEPVSFRSVGGQNFPESNLNLRVFAKKVGARAAYDARNRIGARKNRVATLEDVDIMDAEGNLIVRSIDESQFRDRGFSSDYVRPDVQLEREEMNRTLGRYLTSPSEFKKETTGILEKFLDNRTINPELYDAFVSTFIKTIQEDADRIVREGESKFLTKGEKDRITQRTVVGIIKNKPELFRELAYKLQEQFKIARKSNTEPNTFIFTSKDGTISEVIIDPSFVDKAYATLQKELKTIKEERLSRAEIKDRARRLLEITAKGLEEGSLQVEEGAIAPMVKWFEGEQMPEGALIEMLSGDVKDKPTRVTPKNYKTISDIDLGGRVGGKTKHSYTEVKDLLLSGKLFSTPLFKRRMKELGITELESLERLGSDGAEFTVDPETGSLVMSKPMSQEYLGNLDNWIKNKSNIGFSDTAVQFIGEQFKIKLNQLIESAGLEPELFVRWGLAELMKLKDQLTTKASQFNETALRVAGEEYTILSTTLDEFASKNNIDLSSVDLYRETLLNSGFSGQVKKAVNPESIVYQIKSIVEPNTPFGDIVQQFNNFDFLNAWQILRSLVEADSPEQLLLVLPKSSIRNSILELEQMGLIINKTESEDELINLLSSGASLQDVFTITENGLKALQVTRHNVNQLGYFGAMSLKNKVNNLLIQNYPQEIIGTKVTSKDPLRKLLVTDYDNYFARLSENTRVGVSNSIKHLVTLGIRKQLIEKQLQLINQAEEKGLDISRLISSGDSEKRQRGMYYLDLLRTNESSLREELIDITRQLDKLQTEIKPEQLKVQDRPKLQLNKDVQPQVPERISYKAWDGAGDATSLYEKIMQALDGNTTHYVGKWKNSAKTALQDDMMAWAYGMNNQPQTKPSEFAPTLVESKRAQRYDGTGKPVFTSEDLAVPENAELSGMLSEDLGEIATKYAATRGARDSADLALRNRLKQQYGFDLPVGYGWTDFMDLMRDIIQKYKTNPPRLSNGKVDTVSAERMSEYMEALNQYVLQNTGREIPQKSMPSGVFRMLKRGRMLSLGMLGPSMGMSVAFTELPLVLARKNGSLQSFLKGFEVLGSSASDRDIRYTAIAYQKLKHGYNQKFGGDAIGNSERSYIKRMSYFFKKMFKPNEEQLRNSGQSKVWAGIDNFLENKAALSMEAGGMSQFVDRVLSIAYEKEKMNLFNLKDKLLTWIDLFNNERFKSLAELAERGDVASQKELVKLFKQYSRESGVSIEVGSYLWMSKLGNKEDIIRLINIMEQAADTYGSFDMKKAVKNVLDSQFGSAANKITSKVDMDTLSKLSYYLELSARGASPEPFGISSPLFKWKGNELGRLITFLATYPIAAYQMYSIRNGTTHTAAAMIAVALGVMGMEIFAKRMRDVLSGKKNINEVYDEYKNAPLAYFLRDMSYAQTGGILDQFINPFFQILGKSQLPEGRRPDPKDFFIATPQIGDLVGLQGMNDILKQTTQAMSGLGKGSTAQLVDIAGRAITTGTVGKVPADAAQALYNLTSKTKPSIWDSVIQKYSLTNPGYEVEYHDRLMKDITKELLEGIFNKDIPNPYSPSPIKQEKLESNINRLNQISQPRIDNNSNIKPIGKPLSPSSIPSVIGTPPRSGRQSQSTQSKSIVTPNLINALMDSKGVSSLLVDELIRNNNQ